MNVQIVDLGDKVFSLEVAFGSTEIGALTNLLDNDLEIYMDFFDEHFEVKDGIIKSRTDVTCHKKLIADNIYLSLKLI